LRDVGRRYEGTQPWQIQGRSEPGRLIEGYASAPSYFPRDVLKLAVSTTAPSYVATIWRVSGSAPADSPFVRVATIESTPGRQQAAPVVDATTKMVRAPWDWTTTFPIPPDWPSGVYLVRLDSTQGAQSYVPFVLRSRSATKFLVVSSALTWQAYNEWGGSSVYVTRIGDPLPGVTRALGVSFDRPYATDGGAGQLFFLELPLISWLERQGLDVSFTTDYNLSVNPADQPLPGTVIFNGHDEYWGVPLYDWLDAHVTAGDMGVAMLAADSGYWPVSFGLASPDGPQVLRTVRCGAPRRGVRVIRTPIRAPRATHSRSGSFRTVRQECLDHVLIYGRRYLERVLQAYVAHYVAERPHRGLSLAVPVGTRTPQVRGTPRTPVERGDVLGGLIHEYRWAA
jgi:hypothetical protein